MAGLLKPAKLCDDLICPAAKTAVACGGKCMGKGGQIVARGVPAQKSRGLLPTSWRNGSLGIKAKGFAEIIEHTVRVQE